MNSKEKLLYLLERIKNSKSLIPIIGIIILNIELIFFIINFKVLGITFIIFGIILNVIFIYLWREKLENKIQMDELTISYNCLNEQNKCLINLNDTLRCFKHDFSNIIQVIHGYLLMDNLEALKKYFDRLLKESNHVKNLEIISAKKINNPAIYGILLNKYLLAEEKNIDMNIDICTNVDEIGDKSYEVSRIMGILLDNAIEAAVECDEKLVNVSLVQVDNKTKKITIENTYNDKDVKIQDIYKKEFSSKKGNTGLGLWETKHILEKEEQISMETSKNNRLFRQEIGIQIY